MDKSHWGFAERLDIGVIAHASGGKGSGGEDGT